MARCACGGLFGDEISLGQHKWAKKHCFCLECNKRFRTTDAVKQHCFVNHSKCGDCDHRFSSSRLLRRHQRSLCHCFCQHCNRFFSDRQGLSQHLLRSSIHQATQFHYCDCNHDFVSNEALNQHLTDKIHSTTDRDPENYCRDCRRGFVNVHALSLHHTSLVHVPISNLKCIASKKCEKRFTSPSALLHHLESSTCCSGITRQRLGDATLLEDTEHIITTRLADRGEQLVTGTSSTMRTSGGPYSPALTEDDDSDGVLLLTPTSSTTDHFPLSPTGQLTPKSSNSASTAAMTLRCSFTCPLCPLTRPPFTNRCSLEQHLASPVHAPSLFHCPLSLVHASLADLVKEPKSFKTLSGLSQHLESGACGGGKATMKRAIRYVEEKLRLMGFGSVALLIQ